MGKIQEVLSDEESMNQIKKLAEMLGMENGMGASPDTSSDSSSGNNNSQSGSAPAFDFDVNKIMALKSIMAKANQHDSSTDFLMALRPLLKDETKVKADKVIKIFRIMAIWPVIKESGILGGDLFGLLQ